MKITVLGWGSLVWKPGDLPIATSWLEGGPRLPLEFSRLSNDSRLTLVIDREHGRRLPTRFALLAATDLASARSALAAREGTKVENIGYVVTASSEQSCRTPEVVPDIRSWAQAQATDAVVWTDLPPKFSPSFSVDAARAYLVGLTDPNIVARAREYIERAPPEVRTCLRAALEASGWVERRSYDDSLYGLIVSLRKQGLTYEAIAEELSQRGVATPRGGTSWNKGNVWHYEHNVDNLRLRY